MAPTKGKAFRVPRLSGWMAGGAQAIEIRDVAENKRLISHRPASDISAVPARPPGMERGMKGWRVGWMDGGISPWR